MKLRRESPRASVSHKCHSAEPDGNGHYCFLQPEFNSRKLLYVGALGKPVM